MKFSNVVLKFFLVVLIIFACDDSSSLGPTTTSNSFEPLTLTNTELHGNKDCHAVRGTITAEILPGGTVGMVNGDIEGTISTVLLPDLIGNTDKFVTGSAIHLAGSQTVEVNGSTIEKLVGRTIIWSIQSRAIHLPPIRRVSNTIRIIEGAESGNLVSHGVIDLINQKTNFVYEGNICP